LFLRIIKKFADEDDGNVESSMVLIPLLSLFLIAAQLTVTIHGRNMEKISAQDEASVRAISGEFKDSDTYLHIYSPDPNQNLDLVISHRRKTLPSCRCMSQNCINRGDNHTNHSDISIK